MKKTEFFIPSSVKRLATRFQTQTEKHKITTDFPENFPSIMADVGRLEQVITNLISNSIKYSEKGEIRISGQAKSDIIICCVSDEGEGIAPQDIPYVFDRFFRSADALRTKKGAGLGLYLAKAIIEAHKGKIWVDTEHGNGARICFSLPIESEE